MACGAELNYSRRLRQVARQIGVIVKAFVEDQTELTSSQQGKIDQALRGYADLIGPWAESVARLMVADVSRRNSRNWKQSSDDLSKAMRVELQQAPTGTIFTGLMQEQVSLIKSLPLEAAERVHNLATEAKLTGKRPAALVSEILKTGKVSEARAKVIARTEVSRAASSFTQARAQFAGSDGYIWRTSKDVNVRDSHAAMEGKYVRWSQPPMLDNLTGHAGCLPNCRCFPEPVLPDL